MQASGSTEDVSLRDTERAEWSEKLSRCNDTIVELTSALRESRDTEESAVRQVELLRNEGLTNEQSWEREKRTLLQKIDRLNAQLAVFGEEQAREEEQAAAAGTGTPRKGDGKAQREQEQDCVGSRTGQGAAQARAEIL